MPKKIDNGRLSAKTKHVAETFACSCVFLLDVGNTIFCIGNGSYETQSNIGNC